MEQESPPLQVQERPNRANTQPMPRPRQRRAIGRQTPRTATTMRKRIARAPRVQRQANNNERSGSEYEPLRVKRPARRQTSRVDATGNEEVFICPFCQVEYYNRYCCKKHIDRTCTVAREHYITSRQEELERQKVRELQTYLEHEINAEEGMPAEAIRASNLPAELSSRLLHLQTHMKGLESELSKLKHNPDQFTDHQRHQRAKALATQCLTSEFMNGVKSILHAILVDAFTAGLNMKMKVENKVSSLQLAIYEKLQKIQLFGDLDGWREKLKKFHAELQSQKIKANCAASTISRLRKGFNFLVQYTDQQIKTQALVVSDLLGESVYGRTAVVVYYKKLLEAGYEFSMYPRLPKRMQIYRPVASHLEPISFKEVVEEVENLYNNGNQILSSDLWMVTTMGYRRSDIKRLQFFSMSERKFVRAVSLIQHKNQHRSLRVVPESLAQLIKQANAPYPITEQRMVSVQQHCLKRFHRFYGLRSLCITSISRALHQMNQGLGQFHRSSTTTAKFYIDDRSGSYIDSAFSLPWLSGQKVQFAKVMFVFGKEREPVEEVLNKDLSSDITTSADEIVTSNWLDSVVCASEKDLKQYIQINQNGKKALTLCQIIGRNQVLQGYHQQLQPDWFESLQQLFAHIVGRESRTVISFKILMDQSRQRQQDNLLVPAFQLKLEKIILSRLMSVLELSDEQIIKIVSSIYSINFVLYTITQPIINPSIKVITNSIPNKLPVVIVKYDTREGTYYQISENSINEDPRAILTLSEIQREISSFEARCVRAQDLSNQEEFSYALRELDRQVATGEINNKPSQMRERIQQPQVGQLSRSRAAKQRATQKIRKITKEEKIPNLTAKDPVCQALICKGRHNQLTLDECKAGDHHHLYIQCLTCKVVLPHRCSDWHSLEDKFVEWTKVKVVATGGLAGPEDELRTLTFISKENNIREQIGKRGFKITNQAWYLWDVPKKFTCNYRVFSANMSRAIIENRQRERFLPLAISQSKIKGAGQGVFASVRIPSETLICSYLGEIGTNESLCKGDSLFTLGWIGGKCIMIGPQTYSNVGRFINSSETSNNCQSMMGLLKHPKSTEGGSSHYEICVLIYSIRVIKEGQELRYPYGDYFPLKNIQENQEETQIDQ